MVDTLYKEYTDPIAVLRHTRWEDMPKFIYSLARRIQVEKVDEIWRAKETGLSQDEFRKKVLQGSKEYIRKNDSKNHVETVREAEKNSNWILKEIK